jgi:hypothetical protein
MLEEFDPEKHPQMKKFSDTMPSDDWQHVREWTRRSIRNAVIGFVCGRANMEALISWGIFVSNAGRDEFLENLEGNLHDVDQVDLRADEILENDPQQNLDEQGRPGNSTYGEYHLKTLEEIERRLMGGLDPRAKTNAT